MKKRGQAAMEFLMTYGWAILIVLIAIGVLWYFIGNPSKIVGDKCTLTPPLLCSSQKATATAVTLVIQNGRADAIDIHSISLTDLTGCENTTVGSISAGSTLTVEIPCTSTSGSKLKSNIRLQYNESESGGLTDIVKTGELLVSVA